jgi:hypothetical protein
MDAGSALCLAASKNAGIDRLKDERRGREGAVRGASLEGSSGQTASLRWNRKMRP